MEENPQEEEDEELIYEDAEEDVEVCFETNIKEWTWSTMSMSNSPEHRGRCPKTRWSKCVVPQGDLPCMRAPVKMGCGIVSKATSREHHNYCGSAFSSRIL